MASLAAKVAALVGESTVKLEAVAGGDINDAFCAVLGSGRQLFVKTHRAALAQIFLREAEGLAWLAEAKALRLPEVVAASDADERGPACLVLEYIERGRPGAGYDERLGRGLAALHRYGAPRFGHDVPNYLATLPQDNTQSDAWPEFYAERRLAPLGHRATQRGVLPSAVATRLRRLCERMATFTGDPEPPARLHGDLWGGNAIAAASGEPVLIDPAVYGGHREIDLAMMRLFGGFTPRVFDAYEEAYPRAAGHEERVALYQVYPLLAHVNLFGSSYVAQLDRAVRQYVD
jgi:fructosamine-3-kinase